MPIGQHDQEYISIYKNILGSKYANHVYLKKIICLAQVMKTFNKPYILEKNQYFISIFCHLIHLEACNTDYKYLISYHNIQIPPSGPFHYENHNFCISKHNDCQAHHQLSIPQACQGSYDPLAEWVDAWEE
jgi:hypothetical protein